MFYDKTSQTRLEEIPTQMREWELRLDLSSPAREGIYEVVDIKPATIEQHHQVLVLDPDGFPMQGVPVIFGFPGGGPNINLPVSQSSWTSRPAVLKGNLQYTLNGYAQHTTGEGGEDIWIHDVDGRSLHKSSDIVKNCLWIADRFIHTGVFITFKLRDVNYIPMSARIENLLRGVGIVSPVDKGISFFEDDKGKLFLSYQGKDILLTLRKAKEFYNIIGNYLIKG